MDFTAQIGKAARLLDLKGDVLGALRVLEAVVSHPQIDEQPSAKLEALTFLADLSLANEDYTEAARYVALAETVHLDEVEPDLADYCLQRLREIQRSVADHSDPSRRIASLSPEDGLSFLELLAHNLTIEVRKAAGSRQPWGPRTEDETRNAMYWLNEALHEVVQTTRNLRTGRETWEASGILRATERWLEFKQAGDCVRTAVERSFRDLAHVSDRGDGAGSVGSRRTSF